MGVDPIDEDDIAEILELFGCGIGPPPETSETPEGPYTVMEGWVTVLFEGVGFPVPVSFLQQILPAAELGSHNLEKVEPWKSPTSER